MNCRFRCTTFPAVTVKRLETGVWEIVLVAGRLIGACWETFMFVMLSVNGAELPVYVHRTVV